MESAFSTAIFNSKMATQWSGEQDVAKYGDLQASSMAVDCLGIWTVLAGRHMLTMVDLRNPKEKVMKNPRQSKWDISCVQWNPHPSHGHFFVTACNQRLDLLSWRDGVMTHQCSMKGHARTISDVGWSPFDVNIIATCSVDTYINLWDVRDPKKQVGSFQAVAGASQVKWNKVKNNMFATTHEGDIRIWDTRKGTSPVAYIYAHPSKIHGLDWCPTSDFSLASSGQDCTVKFWDINNPRQSKGMINQGSPVWRARYTPFGQGIITVLVPQLRRGDNSVYLWNISHNTAVHQFVGHHDVILEFQWRKQQEDSKDFQLVTWSKDQSLRIWKIDPQLQKRCGHDTGDINDSSENESPLASYEVQSQSETDKADHEFQRQMSMSPDNYPVQQPRTLQQEFDLINTDIPNISVEEMDVVRRSCRVTALSRANLSIGLTMRFPDHYPNNEAPSFEFSDPVNTNLKQKLLRVLSETSSKHVKRNTNCLEPCLRQLSSALELPINSEERRTPETEIMPFPTQQVSTKMSQGSYMPMHGIGASYQDMNIPFPRTSGARFSAAGYLVVFGRAQEAQKGPSGTESTPKALSDLVDYFSKYRLRNSLTAAKNYHNLYSRSPPTHNMDHLSVKEWYYRQQVNASKKSNWRKQRSKDNSDAKNKDNDKLPWKPNLAPVKLYDSSCLLPIDKYLGENYKIDTENIPEMCMHNSSIAASVGRKDLVQLWSMVALIADKNLKPSYDPDHGVPWGRHPFGRPLLKSMMDFYCKVSDVQTLAMLCCVFWNRQDGIVQKKAEKVPTPSTEYIPTNDDNDSEALASQLADKSGNTSSPHSQMTSPTTLTHFQSHLSEVASHPNLAILTGVTKFRRSNSWSCLEDSFEDYRFDEDGNTKEKESERLMRLHENYCKMLDPSGRNQYEQYLKSYADILYHWGLRNQSKHVLKFATYGPEPHTGIEFGVKCHTCYKEVRGSQCGTCKNWAFNCVICHTAVKGSSNFCLNCGHGGHTSHLLEWFKLEEECPTGCGCKCLQGKTSVTM